MLSNIKHKRCTRDNFYTAKNKLKQCSPKLIYQETADAGYKRGVGQDLWNFSPLHF